MKSKQLLDYRRLTEVYNRTWAAVSACRALPPFRAKKQRIKKN